MVEISLSGSGEGPQAETPGAYSTKPGTPGGGREVSRRDIGGARANEPRRTLSGGEGVGDWRRRRGGPASPRGRGGRAQRPMSWSGPGRTTSRPLASRATATD